MSSPPFKVASQEEYNKLREELLLKEKELTHMRDQVTHMRQQLPWVKITKEYVFEGPNGPTKLSELFQTGKNDLLIYHLMYQPSWTKPCIGCSCWADSFNKLVPWIQTKCNFVVISKAPYKQLEEVARNRKWTFPFLSSFNCDFNADYNLENKVVHSRGKEVPVEQEPAASALHKEGDTIYHTYTVRNRGLENLNSIWGWYDMLPGGRETWSPEDAGDKLEIIYG